MRYNILIGGKAGQGINKISEIISNILTKEGYFIFNYRDYPSLIRGGHNFNVLTISDEYTSSNDSLIDSIIAMDEKTLEIHKNELKKNPWIIKHDEFESLGLDANIAQAAAYLKIIGVLIYLPIKLGI